MSELNTAIEALTADIHARNVKAGWWSDLATGESILTTRNRPEMLILVVSEVSEADAGVLGGGLMDDKLPHLPMFDVELADVNIRLADLIGAETALHGPLAAPFDYEAAILAATEMLRAATPERRLLTIINKVSDAMEHIRKRRVTEFRFGIAQAFAITVAVANLNGIDLFDVIAQKLEFNANRADHKVENRRKDDGKQF